MLQRQRHLLTYKHLKLTLVSEYSGVTPVPEEPVEASASVGSGYGESKWVAEKLLLLAGSKTSLQPTVVRIGQVSGGLNGCWNPSEWIPSIVQSVKLTKCLPSLNQVRYSQSACSPLIPFLIQEISLIPLDVASRIIVELRESTTNILHLTHPKPVSWNVLFDQISKVLQVPLVPYSQWVSYLESAESEEALEANPALRLLTFYKTLNPHTNSQLTGLPQLVTDAARKASPTLEDASQLDENEAIKWLNYWKAVGVVAF